MNTQHHGFKLITTAKGFKVRDTCKINNWGTQRTLFATEALADDYAYACHDFKEGRTMQVRKVDTGF